MGGAGDREIVEIVTRTYISRRPPRPTRCRRDENSYGRYDAELALITYDLAVKLFKRTLVADATPAPAAGGSAGAGVTTN